MHRYACELISAKDSANAEFEITPDRLVLRLTGIDLSIQCPIQDLMLRRVLCSNQMPLVEITCNLPDHYWSVTVRLSDGKAICDLIKANCRDLPLTFRFPGFPDECDAA